MPADRLVKLPDNIDYKTGAAMMLQGMTVRYLLRQTYKVGKGTTMLLHAAAGGIGLIACQWARHLGATIIGTVSTDDKAKLAKEAGCTHVINYKTEDFVKRTKELTGGQGVDVVYDAVGKDTYPGLARLPQAARPVGELRQRLRRHHQLRPPGARRPRARSTPRGRRSAPTSPSARTCSPTPDELFDVVGKGIVKINVNHTYPLKDAAKAHARPRGPQDHRLDRAAAVTWCHTGGLSPVSNYPVAPQ